MTGATVSELDAGITAGAPSNMPRRTETPTQDVMRESLSVLLRPALDGAADTDTLRDAVCLYVAFARERGDRAERVMIDLKQQVRAVAGVGRSITRAEQLLTERVIHWCIEGYYGPWNAGDQDPT